ncbi:transketolase [Dysgonomonas sp. 520]|uniref:transketolase n=1 Tax=Dysgonomonas sp. 520 TaxID=2302931 RepID=UPI0013D07CFF|nr:transketolase [Dysgonomonas sp. 520]NDW08597.1 transketolase [Dysgonomonas sp. 520]
MIEKKEIDRLEHTAIKLRKRLLEVVYNAKAGHIGGGLSSLNMLTALYFHTLNIDPQQPQKENRDRFIMSKGHCVEALYCTLEGRGFIAPELLDTYGKYGTSLAGHPTVKTTGVEVNTGALGHGLSIGVGLSIAAKMDKKDYKTYVLMGDGEQGEGSIYEAAMSASHYKLDNLVAIIDRNGLQISDTTENVMSLEPIDERWTAFGWDVVEVDGDDMGSIVQVLDNIDFENKKPHLIISKTTKGKGISCMENILKWHHGVPNESEYTQSIAELEACINNYQTI